MPKLDTLLMDAHIALVVGEYPDGDPIIVRGLYERFVDCQDRQPALDEFREYVFGITSTHEWLTLREMFDPHEPTVEELEALSGPPWQPDPPRRGGRRGRPKGSRLTTRQQLIDAYRSLRRRYGRPPSQTELASNLDPPIAKRTLQQHLREYGLPWPPE